MAIFTLSASALKLAKWAVRAGEYVVPLGLAWLEDQLLDNPEAIAPIEWRRFQVVCARQTPVGLYEDKATFKLDLVNITSGDIDTTWTAGDYTTVKAAFDTFLGVLQSKTDPALTFQQLRAYKMAFNPTPDVLRPFADSGPPEYTAGLTLTGTSATSAHTPYQVAATVTMRTAWARHWGRIYLPNPDMGTLDTYGRWNLTYRQAIANGAHALLDTLGTAGFYGVVPVGQLDKQPFHALLGISQTVVDDIPDVQRRRRPRMPNNRTVGV